MTTLLETPLAVPPEAVYVPVHGSRPTLVDPDIAELFSKRRLFLAGNHPGYVAFSLDREPKFLHNIVLPHGPRLVCDHINNDVLDNRRANLRIVTQSVNVFRATLDCSLTHSTFRGVHARSESRWWPVVRWCAQRYRGPSFRSTVLVALQRDDIARRVTGQEEGMNFPLTLGRCELRHVLERT